MELVITGTRRQGYIITLLDKRQRHFVGFYETYEEAESARREMEKLCEAILRGGVV